MHLSPREQVVYGLASRGYTMRYIAAKLCVSPRTVEAHIRHIYEKTGVRTRDELIEWHEISGQRAARANNPGAARFSSCPDS